MSAVELGFKVPDELYPLVDDHTLEVFEKWSRCSLDDMNSEMPKLSLLPTSRGRKIGAAVLLPKGDYDNRRAIALVTSYAQKWKSVQNLIGKITQEIVAPEVPFYVFTNNGFLDNSAYELNDQELQTVAEGDLRPLAEQIVSALEGQGVDQIGLTGYSFGGSVVPAVARVGSDVYEVTHMNIDEAPNTAKLIRDFRASTNDGGSVTRDSGLPVSAEISAPPGIWLDYAAFIAAGLFNPSNRALRKSLGHQRLMTDIKGALVEYPSMVVKLGSVAGSKLLELDESVKAVTSAYPDNVRYKKYTGSAAHKHNTGDNTMAYALMVKDGLRNFTSS